MDIPDWINGGVYAYIRCSFERRHELRWDLVDIYWRSNYYNKHTRLRNDVRALMLKTTGCLETNAMSCEIIQME